MAVTFGVTTRTELRWLIKSCCVSVDVFSMWKLLLAILWYMGSVESCHPVYTAMCLLCAISIVFIICLMIVLSSKCIMSWLNWISEASRHGLLMLAKWSIHIFLILIVHLRNSNLNVKWLLGIGSSICGQNKFKTFTVTLSWEPIVTLSVNLAWKHIWMLSRIINIESLCRNWEPVRIPWQLSMEDTLVLRRKLKTASVLLVISSKMRDIFLSNVILIKQKEKTYSQNWHT